MREKAKQLLGSKGALIGRINRKLAKTGGVTHGDSRCFMSCATLSEALVGARILYMAEVERLALKLRPRFLSGELREMTRADGERMLEEQAAGSTWEPPFYALEALCAERFGGSERLALLSTACASLVPWGPWTEPRWMAGNAVALDVLAVARKLGMLKPGEAAP